MSEIEESLRKLVTLLLDALDEMREQAEDAKVTEDCLNSRIKVMEKTLERQGSERQAAIKLCRQFCITHEVDDSWNYATPLTEVIEKMVEGIVDSIPYRDREGSDG